MERGINVTLHNKFDIEVHDASTGELKQQVTAYNIVLDALWPRVLARSTFMRAIHIGTGTGTLDPARTSLFTLLVARSATWDSTGSTIDNLYRRIRIQLEPAEYVGSTITEVGVAYGTTSTDLVTHALLTDSEGTPISIVKTDTDVVIIYATVFFTVGTLPSYVKLTGIRYDGYAGNNQLIGYLLNQSGSIESDIRLGAYGDTTATYLPSNLRGGSIANKATDITTDAATKRMNFPTRRFEVAEANGPIQEICIGGSFNIQLPNENYTGTQYTDVLLSGQDGTKVNFLMPSINTDQASIVVKVNNVVTPVTVIPMPYYKIYRPSSTIYDSLGFYDNNKFGYMSTGSTSEALIVENDDTEWRCTKVISPLPNYSYSAGAQFRPGLYANIYRSSRTALTVIDAITNAVKLTYTQNNGYMTIPGFIDDNTCLFIIKTSPTSPSYAFAMFYTTDAGATWQTTGTMLGFNGAEYAQSVKIAKSKKIGFQPAIIYSSSNFKMFSFDTTARSMTQLTVVNPVSNAYGLFSDDENLLVTFGRLAGINTYEEVEGTWTKTNIIPDEGTIVYDTGWLMGNDIFIAGDTSTSLYNVWKKISGTWTLILRGIPKASLLDSSGDVPGQSVLYNETSPDGYTLMSDSQSGYLYVGNTTDSCVIRFATPPLSTDEIKVSYVVRGIHKTTNYVLDVSGYIEFGEG